MLQARTIQLVADDCAIKAVSRLAVGKSFVFEAYIFKYP
jgi:hypothetical protein